MRNLFWSVRLLAALLMVLQVGCACMGTRDYPALSEVQYERGEPCDLVDVTGNVLSIPSKILLWDKRVDNHCVSMSTEDSIKGYVAANGLDSTKVRFNQYDPMGEWKRLGKNKAIPPLVRYTFGTVQTLGYTLLPGRIFGGDTYNPYTDTLSVYSDVPSLGMAEIAYAKDLRARTHRGWYAFGQEFPILGMLHEGKATKDVLGYLAVQGTPREQREGFKVLYPRYGAAWGSTVDGFLGDLSPVGMIAGTVIGHVAGRNEAAQIESFRRDPANAYATTPSQNQMMNQVSDRALDNQVVPVSHEERIPREFGP